MPFEYIIIDNGSQAPSLIYLLETITFTEAFNRHEGPLLYSWVLGQAEEGKALKTLCVKPKATSLRIASLNLIEGPSFFSYILCRVEEDYSHKCQLTKTLL